MKSDQMKNKEKQRRRIHRWLALVRPALLLLTTVILFSYASFSWMRREWTPFIEQSNITIATGGSLVFEFEGGSGVSTGKSINEILGLEKDFVLKPVSSQTGGESSFFSLDLQRGEGNEVYQYLDVSDYEDSIQMGIENGYIEFQMMLYSPDAEGTIRYVYVHPESHIRLSDVDGNPTDAEKCIRMSVTLESTAQTWIFGADGVTGHSGINPVMDESSQTYVMDGVPYYADFNAEDKEASTLTEQVGDHQVVVSSENFRSMSDLDGGDYDESGSLITQDTTQTLFALTSGESTKQWVTVRIWAEGSDPHCTDTISGAEIDLKLKFSSYTQTTT